MAATVLHFGADDCNRVLVLRSVGYSVDLCSSLTEFRSAFEQRNDPDAVVVAVPPGSERNQVVTLIREHSQARLILFENFYDTANAVEFDLVIPPQMPPEEWLQKIAGLIEQSRALYARSQAIRERSGQLMKDPRSAKQQSVFQRKRSASERAKAKRVIDSIPQKPGPADEV